MIPYSTAAATIDWRHSRMFTLTPSPDLMFSLNPLIPLESSGIMHYNRGMKRGRPLGRKLAHSVTFRLDDEVMAALARMAEGERRPLAMMARLLLEEAMVIREKKVKKKPA